MAEATHFQQLAATTASLEISLTPSPHGVIRSLDAKGLAYSLDVWADVLEELATELRAAHAKGKAADEATMVANA